GQGCLQRALTAALLRRMGGSWPTWCTGVRVAPFRAHVWGEVDGVPVGEPAPPGYRTPTLTVPRRPDAAGERRDHPGPGSGRRRTGVPPPEWRDRSAHRRTVTSSPSRAWR
ncbi:lasso peptide biosynthesis B2 protein, partial [Streptomyces specialis]|uniref:lasso peptide biosynthesis B2 protein n=1 Tax=Streptomyces specialis TaxID=498367 RepID=UPI000D14F94B